MTKKILWWEPQIGSKEKKFIDKVLASNFPNEGAFTFLFEKKIAGLLNSGFAITATSGTAAIFLALKGLGIGKGDEVIVPDLSFVAAANAVDLTGAKVVLVDINPNTLGIELRSLQKNLTKKTKAIIPVHISGYGADIDSIIKIARSHNIFVIEDAAEAFLSKYKGRFLGTFGDAGCFSFSPAKTITTGQGGAIVTNNSSLQKRIRELKDQGRSERGTGGDDLHNSIGYNFKFTNLQAALGLGQLTYLRSRLKRLAKNHKLYVNNLKNIRSIKVFEFDLEAGELPQWTILRTERRNELDQYLGSHNIECRRFWFPVHTQKPYRQNDKNFPNSTMVSSQLLWLPSAFTMTDSDVEYVCNLVKKFCSST
ncbi:MAG: DegT/DnrJ/EryC1/StrS family aminotransferase [Patescibacteria group bacterium]